MVNAVWGSMCLGVGECEGRLCMRVLELKFIV